MNTTVSITELRNHLFTLTEKLVREGGDLLVEKDGKTILKVSKFEDTARVRADRLIRLSKKLAGIWKDDADREFFRGAKEKKYMKELGISWKK